MPQYTHHNFYSNFTASLKSGDLDLTNDILANELSDFIVFDTDKVVKALNQADIKIDNKVTDEQIVDVFIKEIGTNVKLAKAMAYIIAEGNEMLVAANNKEKQLKMISTISEGLSKVAKEVAKNPDAFKSSTMDQIVSKAAKRTEYKRTIWNKDQATFNAGKVLLISMGVLAVALVILYYRQKKSVEQAIPNMILGGNMTPPPDPGNNPFVPSPDPVVTVPPAAPAPAPVTVAQPTIVQPIELLPEPVPAPAATQQMR